MIMKIPNKAGNLQIWIISDSKDVVTCQGYPRCKAKPVILRSHVEYGFEAYKFI